MENTWKHKLNIILIVSFKVMKIFQELKHCLPPPRIDKLIFKLQVKVLRSG